MGMSNKKINKVLDIYDARVKRVLDEIAPPTCDADQNMWDKFEHLGKMIGKVRDFLVENRREKAFRWLGFMQGVFYAYGIYSIEEMANHNRPTKEELREQLQAHSLERLVTCPACGDLDGCHLWKEYADAPSELSDQSATT